MEEIIVKQRHNAKKLGILKATAICGNDIASSCFYVSALAIAYAGQYAFISLILVGIVLFFFRKIYGEAVGALPLNGGAYNLLLNTTSKVNASVAACLTILSYMATAVISASTGMNYLHSLLPYFPVFWATFAILTIFLLLTISGISESATVATVIFILNLVCLTTLLVSAIVYISMNGINVGRLNFDSPLKGGLTHALFLGFSMGMLGVTGFETSSNFVEEQAEGVFPKTLKYMWIIVMIVNPAIALLGVCVMPINEIANFQDAYLSFLGKNTAGNWLEMVISIDAAVVLSGAVLTAYIGVNGLMKRMALDRIFPQNILKKNKKGSTPRIIITFYFLCLSILFLTRGKIEPLAGVYTISFLSVMIFFGLGNLLLKIKRSRLPRPEYATSTTVLLGIFGIFIALYGNVKVHPEFLVVFLQYFIPAILVIYVLLRRKQVISYLLMYVTKFFDNIQRFTLQSRARMKKEIDKLNNQPFVFFTKGDNVATLNKVIIYVKTNEITQRLKIVNVLKGQQQLSEVFIRDFEALDRAYPDMNIEFLQVKGEFGPDLIDKLSKEWNIPKNFMFIGSPGDHFPHAIQDLGGVRLII